MKIGVLALQGAFEEHIQMLKRLGADAVEIRSAKDLYVWYDGIIIPGGESTVISKLLIDLGMMDRLCEILHSGIPVFGTCAGLILMSSETGDERCLPLSLLNITAKRNAYGRQLGSFAVRAEFKGIGEIPMVFIRAPYIEKYGENVDILSVVDGKAVGARQGNFLVTAFHPELTDDLSVHKYFLDMVK